MTMFRLLAPQKQTLEKAQLVCVVRNGKQGRIIFCEVSKGKELFGALCAKYTVALNSLKKSDKPVSRRPRQYKCQKGTCELHKVKGQRCQGPDES